jgi:dTDP-4-dehydrorhamnose reductase
MIDPTRGRIVLIGARGMLGRAWVELFDVLGRPHTALDRRHFDVTDRQAVAAHIGSEAGLVINCAAHTDVDGAERAEDHVRRTNGAAVGSLARRCLEVGSLLVHYSTDYVFDGRASEPYPVHATRAPQSAYGRSKAEGEELLEQSGCPHLLVRTSWLYAPWGRNFVRDLVALCGERGEHQVLQVVDDQRGRPTSAQHLAAATLALVELGCRGTYHVTDGGDCTRHELATEIARRGGRPCRVEPCSTAAAPRPARRPPYSVLDLSRTEAALGPMSDWRENLADVLLQLPAP